MEELLERVQQSSINSVTFLSTDYFNHFNGAIMILSMLPDQPDLLPEIESWSFKTYFEHFDESGLGIADLAKEAYRCSPDSIRSSFEQIVGEMRVTMEYAQRQLPRLHGQDNRGFADLAMTASEMLQGWVIKGSGLVNGSDDALAQSSIDEMF